MDLLAVHVAGIKYIMLENKKRHVYMYVITWSYHVHATNGGMVYNYVDMQYLENVHLHMYYIA